MNSNTTTINSPQPNAVTVAAIEEVQKMKDNPSTGQIYKSVDDMMKDIL